MPRLRVFIMGCCLLTLSLSVYAKDQSREGDISKPSSIQARLVKEEENAKKKMAVVEVMVEGVKLIDPEKATRAVGAKEAHLHYQVDDGFVIASPAPKLSLHDLSSGTHRIIVKLSDNDHQPLGPMSTVTVKIP